MMTAQPTEDNCSQNTSLSFWANWRQLQPKYFVKLLSQLKTTGAKMDTLYIYIYIYICIRRPIWRRACGKSLEPPFLFSFQQASSQPASQPVSQPTSHLKPMKIVKIHGTQCNSSQHPPWTPEIHEISWNPLKTYENHGQSRTSMK